MTNRIKGHDVKFDLTGQTVLVTGGGSGIGRLLAVGAARRGARVVVWDLSGPASLRVRDEIRDDGGAAECFTVDVSDPEDVARAAAVTGPVDVVVNNAGIVTGKGLLEASTEEIKRTFDVNALGLFWVTRAFLGGMVERKHGRVVTISSAAGLVGVAKQTDYSSSKFAAFGFSESLRVELAKTRSGVTTLVVCPFYVNTGMFDGVRTRFPRLLPILDAQDVATRILDAIEKNSEQLVMPPVVRALALGRLLPVRWFDRLTTILGVNTSMDHFRGR